MEADVFMPDFDDFEKMATDAARLKADILVTKNALSEIEAQCMRAALTDSAYWIGNKRPSMAYCEKIVKEIGNTEEDSAALCDLRNQLAEMTEAYQLLQHLITLSRDKLDLYRTLSANQRKSFL